jgi:hypothetical protein
MKIAIFVLALASAGVAQAQAVKDKPSVTLNPALAYVAYTTPGEPMGVQLYREPSTAETAAYVLRRKEALDKAREKYAKKIARWTADVKDAAANKARSGPKIDSGPRPIEPTDATFAFPPIALELLTAIGPLNRFVKGDRSIYLHAVPPGTYIVYGPVTVMPNGTIAGTCLCLGTVRFDVRAGAVTDMGVFHMNMLTAVEGAKAAGATKPRDEFDLPAGVTTFGIEPAAPGARIDARLGAYLIVQARYLPAGKLPNWQGVNVDRLTAMPSVFRYDRDVMIDLTGQGTAAATAAAR